jgi:hypothetical protein
MTSISTAALGHAAASAGKTSKASSGSKAAKGATGFHAALSNAIAKSAKVGAGARTSSAPPKVAATKWTVSSLR